MRMQVGIGIDLAVIVLDRARFPMLERGDSERGPFKAMAVLATPAKRRISFQEGDCCFACFVLSLLNRTTHLVIRKGEHDGDRFRCRQRQIDTADALRRVAAVGEEGLSISVKRRVEPLEERIVNFSAVPDAKIIRR